MFSVPGGKTFRELMPTISSDQNDVYFRHDWAPPQISLRSTSRHPTWSAIDARGTAVAIRFDSPTRQNGTIERPDGPGWIEIEDGEEIKKIWFVSASVQVRATRGQSISLWDNPNWPTIQQYLRDRYGAHGHNFTQLGLVDFETSGGSILDSFIGRRFGGMVEIAGSVRPIDRSTGIRFFLARRITGGRLLAEDGSGRRLTSNRNSLMPLPPAGSNDTSGLQTGTLTSSGKLFDYDLPGAVMRNVNLAIDRILYNVTFEQAVAIGVPPTAVEQNPWPRITGLGLAVSPLVSWATNYTATVREVSTATHGIVLTLIGTVG
jgi:hypothetical protein